MPYMLTNSTLLSKTCAKEFITPEGFLCKLPDSKLLVLLHSCFWSYTDFVVEQKTLILEIGISSFSTNTTSNTVYKCYLTACLKGQFPHCWCLILIF